MSAMFARQVATTLELYVTLESTSPKKLLYTSIATSLVGVRLDYCNAVYYGIARNISYW